MECKKLTLKRATTENVAESTEPVISPRRKKMVVNTHRKSNKLAKTAPTQPTKKVLPLPSKKQKAVVIPLEKKVIPPTPPKQLSVCSLSRAQTGAVGWKSRPKRPVGKSFSASLVTNSPEIRTVSPLCRS